MVLGGGQEGVILIVEGHEGVILIVNKNLWSPYVSIHATSITKSKKVHPDN